MKDMVISTLPIKPRTNPIVGMAISPVIVELLGKKLKIQKNLAINLLHSYNDLSSLLDYNVNYFGNYGLEFDKLILDSENVDKLLEGVEKLINARFIVSRKTEKYMCDCGFVDVPVTAVNNHSDGKIYHMKDGKLICNHCHTACKKYKENSLVFDLKSQDFSHDIHMFPFFEKKDVMTFDKDENINFHLISKTRDTGYQVMCGGEKYNVDIDALWMNFPQIYDQERQIYVASNHQLYPIYVMNLINNALNEKEVFYILNPYLGKSDDLRPDVEKLYERSPIYAKLAIISSLRWKKKDCTWDNSVLRGLSKYDEDILKQLYDEMTLDGFDGDNFEKDLGQFLNYDTTIQHNMNTIKRLVKARNLHN